MKFRCMRMPWVAMALAAVTLLLTPVAAHGAFTLEQILSAPFPSDLTAAPAGGTVAWVLNQQGVRNVWVAEAPDYRGRALTSYGEDDGQQISSLRWTPDARMIVYVRGGAPNSKGVIPNPTSNPAGAERAVWMVALSGGAPQRLGKGHSPAVSPRGDRVVFLRKGQVWAVSLPMGGKAKPVHWITARGSAHSLRWSPDGSRLAFVSNRGDHSFIGVYDVAGKTLRYLDPGVDNDLSPTWSPGGDRIAFLRIPASEELTLFGPKREAQPWSIRIADVRTGQGREVWKARRGHGSVFHRMVAKSQLLWAEGNRLVFPWEGDGWLHLYAVPVEGGEAKLLTPGAFEVEHVILAPNRESVIYSSNQDDTDRRHLWRVGLSGAPPVALTRGRGIEWSPVAGSDGKVLACLSSDARTPAHAAIQIGGAALRPLAPDTLPAGFPREQLVEPRPVTVSAADGMRLHAQLFLPPDAESGRRHPAVVFFHGGSRRQMLLGWHYMGYYHNAYAMNQFLASRGYIVLSVNYRSGTGYGMKFREALHYGARGASEYNDVLGAGLYLRGRADVDPDRIGLWGGSYGGYLTALGLARASDLFAAGVDFHGVHDWNLEFPAFVPGYDPAKLGEAARVAFNSSPMAYVDTWRSPVLLIHGDDDRNVPFAETVQLVELLRKRGVEFELLIFPDEVHGFLRYADWLTAYRAAADFLDRHLKGSSAHGR